MPTTIGPLSATRRSWPRITQISPAPRSAELEVEQWRTIGIAREVTGEPRAAERKARQRPQILDLAVAVTAPAARGVERAGGVEGQRGDRGNPDRRASVGRFAAAGH